MTVYCYYLQLRDLEVSENFILSHAPAHPLYSSPRTCAAASLRSKPAPIRSLSPCICPTTTASFLPYNHSSLPAASRHTPLAQHRTRRCHYTASHPTQATTFVATSPSWRVPIWRHPPSPRVSCRLALPYPTPIASYTIGDGHSTVAGHHCGLNQFDSWHISMVCWADCTEPLALLLQVCAITREKLLDIVKEYPHTMRHFRRCAMILALRRYPHPALLDPTAPTQHRSLNVLLHSHLASCVHPLPSPTSAHPHP